MVTGKSGYFDLAGSYGITLRVYWSETYDVSSNKSVVTIEKLQVKSSKYDGALYWLNGTVSVDGVVLATMSSSAGTHSAYITGLDKFADVKASGNTASWVSQEITHADDGSKSVPIAVSLRGFTPTGTAGDGWEVNTSYSVALTTIPRKSTFTVPDGTLGTAFQIAVERKSASFTHTITYTCGTASGTVCTQSATEDITYTLPLILAEQNTSGVSVSVAFKLQTYSGNTAIGEETKTVTMAIPESVKPSCVLTVTDHMGYADRYGSYVKGLSRFAVSIAADTAYGAAIRSYNVTANGKQYTESEFVTDAISSTAYNTISASVTDTRSRTSNVATETVQILDYAKPAITKLSVVRCNADGTENPNGGCVKLTFSATVTPLNNLNGAEYFVHWKKHNAVDYSGGYAFDDLYGKFSVTNYTYIIEDIDTTASYEVQVTVEDNHFGIVKKGVVSTAFALLHFRSDGTGIGIGKISEHSDSVEFGLPLYDKFGTAIGNGLMAYTGSGDAAIDPNTTLEHLVLTNKNTPNSGFWYIATFFYNEKTTGSNRAQLAIPYSSTCGNSIYHRYCYSGTFTNWIRSVDAANDILVVPKAQVSTSAVVGYMSMLGGIVQFYNSNANAISNKSRMGWMGYSSDKDYFAVVDTSTNGTLIQSSGSIRLQGNLNYSQYLGITYDRLRASVNDTFYLGDATYKWKAVYAINGTIQTSDRNQKENINDIDQRYIELFDRLQPVTFEFNDSESDRVHIGFISQDVKAAMDEVGLTALDFAGYCRDEKTELIIETDPETGEVIKETEKRVLDENGNPVYLYSLRYSEFIALNSKMIQINREKIASQQKEIDELKTEVAELKEMVSALMSK